MRLLLKLFRRRRLERDLEAEIAFHRDMASAAGNTTALGNTTHIKEQSRDLWRFVCLEDVSRDVVQGARRLVRQPAFLTATVVSLALGIGVNITIFSVVRAVLIDELPYHEPDRLVRIWKATPTRDNMLLSVRELESIPALPAVVLATAGCRPGNRVVVRADRDTEEVAGTYVSPDLFTVLGAAPVLGRTFGPADFEPDARSALISSSIWRTHFAGDLEVVGRTIRVNRADWTVVGVMPASFGVCHWGASDRTVWLPDQLTTELEKASSIYAFARLAPDINVLGAERALSDAMPPSETGDEGRTCVRLARLGESEAAAMRSGLLLLQGVAAFILLITCANLANLFLAHMSARERELGVRAALGAGRWRIVRQLLAETELIATLGGLLGVALAYVCVPALVATASWILPPGPIVAVQGPELVGGLALGWLAAMFFGIGPALLVSRRNAIESLRTSHQVTPHGRARLFRSALVASEILLAVVVLTGAGLLLKSFGRVVSLPMGFEARGLILGEVPLSDGTYQSVESRQTFVRRLDNELRTELGSRPWALANSMPYTMMNMGGFRVMSADGTAVSPIHSAPFRIVSASYFETLRLPIVRGRPFSSTDTAGGPNVAILNERFVRDFGDGADLLGRRIRWPRGEFTVVGIAGDTRNFALTAPPDPAIYFSIDQVSPAQVTVAVRASDEAQVASALREAVRRLDTDLPVMRVESVDAKIARTETTRRFYLSVLTLFAGLASALAIVGIYGVTTHVTGLRTREMSVRLALGARPLQIIRLVVFQGLAPIVLGLAGGSIAAAWTSAALASHDVFASQLYEVTPHDPATYAAAAFGLLAVAVVACWIPARRVSRVDPASVLRSE